LIEKLNELDKKGWIDQNELNLKHVLNERLSERYERKK
jgi:hypothetical protein